MKKSIACGCAIIVPSVLTGFVGLSVTESKAVDLPHTRTAIVRAVDLDLDESQEVTLSDGTTARGSSVERVYSESGEYSEILKVTDARGEVEYDFAVVLVIDKSAPDRLPPTIHAAFAPTINIHPGDPLTFKVRSFRTTFGNETWDFGDGSEKVTVKSDGNVDEHAKDGYAVTQHSFAKAGHYLVRDERTNEHGQRAIAHLHVPVERESGAPAR